MRAILATLALAGLLGGGTPAWADRLVRAPAVPQPKAAGDLVGMLVENTQDRTTPPRPLTFGQEFIPGELSPQTHLAARIGTTTVPIQMDVKATHPDGSVRMAIITLPMPEQRSERTTEVMLTKAADAPPGAPVGLEALTGYGLAVDLTLHEEGGATHPFHADVGALLAHALAGGRLAYWMHGPLASEVRVEVPVERAFRLTFDVRAYADGSAYTDVQFNNDIALQKEGGAVTYDLDISVKGQKAYHTGPIKQFQYQTWHLEYWSAGRPHVNFVQDIAHMERTGAIQTYDLATGVDGRLIADEAKQMAGPGFGVLGNAGITTYMPMTGGRPDIGPTTRANTIWLMTQNDAAARYALAQSDAAGSVPWHYYDPRVGTYIRLTEHPTLWADGRAGPGNGSEALTQMSDDKDTGWSPDPAHQPDLSYVPYLLTGSRYRLDQLNAQASWSIVVAWHAPRLNGKGIVANFQSQVRASAWSLREIVEAAFANPDDSPMKRYFVEIAKNNIEYLLDQAAHSKQGDVHGWVLGTYGDDHGFIAPWQQDYLVTTIALAARQQVPGAKQLLEWQTNFLAGRFLSEDKGFHAKDGAEYILFTYPYPGDQFHPYTNWADVGRMEVTSKRSGGGKEWASSTPMILALDRAALAATVSATGSAEAKRALVWLNANAPAVGAREPPPDPMWNIGLQ